MKRYYKLFVVLATLGLNACAVFRQPDAEAQFKRGWNYEKGEGGVKQDYVQAVKWYRLAAERGDADAQNRLGVCYANGYGVGKDVETAYALFRKSAEHGHAGGQRNMGLCYRNGWGVAVDMGEAVEWFRKAAEQGDAWAQNDLGWHYETGTGIAQSRVEAEKWYAKSAEQGYALAQSNWGMFFLGHFRWAEDEKAFDLFSKAAAQGDVRGLYYVGTFYDGTFARKVEGIGTDYNEAANWYRKAAEKGHLEAQLRLGKMYHRGENWTTRDGDGKHTWHRFDTDFDEAVKWLGIVAERGNSEAQVLMGECYYYGKGVGRDYGVAVEWLLKAEKQGNKDAQTILGLCYLQGHGVEQDQAEAVRRFGISAESITTWGGPQFHLGGCYERGEGVTQDLTEAAKWYYLSALRRHAGANESLLRLAEGGNAEAQHNLALIFDRSSRTEIGGKLYENPIESAKWMGKAAELGHAEAQFQYGWRHAVEFKGYKQNHEEAAKWYRAAAEQGHAAAQYNLAICYATGNGVEQDDAEAAEWFGKAAEQGYVIAPFCMGICREIYDRSKTMFMQALQWVPEIAGQGHADVLDNPCVCYLRAQGIRVELHEQVYRDFWSDGRRDYANSQCAVGFLRARGYVAGRQFVVEDDVAEAVEWFRKAARQGFAPAQHNMGCCYE